MADQTHIGTGEHKETGQIRVGSRESALAVAQSKLVIDQISAAHPQLDFSLITMSTTGDRLQHASLESIGGKGVFIKELDRALLDNRIDLAVHSLKDMPMQLASGLVISAYSVREDPRDALVLPLDASPDKTLPIGCSGLRRKLRIAELYPDWAIGDIRGNVLTRLKKLDAGEYGGLVLAVAGLKRLGLEHRISRIFEPEEMLPAAGQGTLAIVTREASPYPYTAAADDADSRVCSTAERAFVRTLDGGCKLPIASYARTEGDKLILTGLYCKELDAEVARTKYVMGSIDGDVADAEELGAALALRLRNQYERGIK